MRLNLTFFIQIINFSATYWFLKKFMFNPVLKTIKDKKNLEKKSLNLLKTEEEKLKALDKEKRNELDNFRNTAKEKYKFSSLEDSEIPAKIYCTVNKKETEKLIATAKSILVKRVPHVD